MSTTPPAPGAPLLVILVDGLGFADASAGAVPFISDEGKDRVMVPVRPVLGYSDAQRAVLLTGGNPDEIDYWMLYEFSDPKESPWRWMRGLSPLDRLGDPLPLRMFKFGLSQSFLKAQARMRGYSDLSIHNIPFRALKWQRPSMAPSIYAGRPLGETPTLFSLATEKHLRWSIIRSDSLRALVSRQSASQWAPRAVERISALHADTKLVFVYMHHPDLFAHRYGVDDERTVAEINAVGRAAGEIVDATRRKLGDGLQTVIVSDHGMNRTTRFVDFSDLVMRPEFGKSFVVALDSTMVRARYLTGGGEELVRSVLDAKGFSKPVPSQERKKLGITFPGERYGDEIFLMEPGTSIYPNFHSLTRPLAMHAYHPDVDDQTAFALFIGDEARTAPAMLGSGRLQMKDLLRAFTSLLRLV